MTKLARIWKEIHDNWDIDIVAVGSVVTGAIAFILSTVGKIDITPVLSLVLALLGLVAISLRRDRQSDTKITEALLEITGSLGDFSGKVGSLHRNKAFSSQHQAYDYLTEMVNKDGVEEAVFLQYSCRTSINILRAVLSKGARVTVFLEHEEVATKVGSQYQTDRIKEATKSLRSDLNGSLKRPEKFTVYKYRVPGSVSGVKIDDRVLCVGWYVYKHVDQLTDKHILGDAVELLGHNIAALVVWKGTSEFEVLNELFTMVEKNYRSNAENVPM